jgi:DNA polymerase-3 subunit alpha
MLAYAQRLQKQAASGQTDLFGNAIDQPVVKASITLEAPAVVHQSHEQLVWERELLGLYLSQHPLEAYEIFLNEQTVPLSIITPEHDGRSVTVGGAITELREITTKNGQRMAFVKIADLQNETELILFPSIYQQTTGIWQRDRVILVKGKVNAKDRDGNVSTEIKILVDDAREVTPEQASAYQSTGKKPTTPKPKKPPAKAVAQQTKATTLTPRVYIRLEKSDNQDMLVSLKETIDAHKGETEVVLVLGAEDSKQIIKLPMRLNAHEDSLSQLGILVGTDNVKLH